ncbi:restriction endonuclease subunit S [Mycoplasmopsis felis]|uniref:restriction endonuclease subunit S n=1 Tax=Mycoplasmopsis felis TaxID=33923 RepID=UPI002DD44910|nr:restriction endonuclease subunit S [Mycoplasmopsis felis]WRX06937.1 restriction endonuclease subunit S [Mycoplasmopsis felis]
MKKVLVPRVRFKGFSEEWKEERFDKIFFNIQEKNKNRYSIKEYISVASNTWKKDVNIKNKQTLWNYSVFRVGDIAYEGHTNEAFPFGRFVINRIGTGIISNIFTVFRPKADLSLDFSQYWVNNNLVMIGLLKRSSKSGIMMNSLTLENVNEEKISLPKYFEQQKIGKLLDQISNLINLENSKLNKLKQVKETLLQKMFPEGNSKTPRIRFRGFNEEWSEERFGDTIEPYRIKNYNNEKLQSYSISNKFGFVNQKEFFENGGKAIRANKSNSLVVFPNSFAYNPARIDVGSIGLYKKEENCLVSPIYEVFKTDRKMNDEFLFNWFKIDKFKWIVNKSKEGSVRNTVYLKNISDYLINFPSYSEQQKIGDFFSKIDTLISLYHSKLNKLKQIKYALLQKMFI